MKAHMNRHATVFARLLLALMLVATGMPALAVAQETPRRSELSAESLIEAARTALAKGELEDAEFLLQGVKPGEGNIDDLDFLYGSIAMAREDWQTAIARFRAMLIRDPTLPRVRLDLALSYFRAKEDGSATYHFRQVLGDKDLPPVVRARTLAFLDAIRRRKTWSVSAAVALAPDSNINAATSSRQVNLFGFPAQLSEDARQTSGVGPERQYLGGIRGAHLAGSEISDQRQAVYADLQEEQVQRPHPDPAGRTAVSLRQVRPAPGTDSARTATQRRDVQPGSRHRAFGRLARGAGLAAERGGWR